MFNNELWNKPAGGGGGGFYSHQIAHSLRMSDANNTTLKITAGTPTSSKTFTYSWWWKRYNVTSTSTQSSNVFCAGTSGGAYVFWPFTNSSVMQANFNFTGGNFGDSRLTTNMQFRDTSAWYHCVLRFDSTQATASNRVRLYVNGVEPTYSSASVQTDIAQDEDISFMNESGVQQGWGGLSGKGTGGEGCDVQLAEIVFNDGQSYGPDSYGETKNGVWIPKDPSGLTFGNNGYYLNFASSSDLGNDVSGNNNDFTPANLSAHDQMLDSPTFNSDSNGGNFCTYNPLTQGSYISLSEGNLKTTGTNVGDEGCVLGTMGVTSGKWYWEVRMISMRYSVPGPGISAGSASATQATTTGGPRNLFYYAGNTSNFLRDFDSTIWGTVTEVETGLAGFSAGDKMMIALDVDNKKVWYGKNGSWFNSGNPATGANPQQSWTGTGFSINPSIQEYDSTSSSSSCANFGQDGTFAGTETAQGNSDDTGYGNFYYDPPTGFLAMCSGNLPTSTAVSPAETDDDFPQKLFSATLWTGNGSGRTISSGSKSDAVWIKRRDGAASWAVQDSTRGTSAALEFNTTGSEDTNFTQGVTAFGSSSFNIGTHSQVNNSSDTYVGYAIGANGGTTTTDTSGDIDGVYQTNDCGFSIMKYSGNGSNAQTVPHGITVGGVATAPSYVIMKNLPDSSNNWRNWSIGYNDGDADSYAEFNDSAWLANQGSGGLFTAKPTSTMLTLTDYAAINASGKAVIVYSFANVEGFIKSGSYIGNANDDGTFLYLGFKPAFFMCKPIVAGNWRIQDTKRAPFNVADKTLYPNLSNAEESNDSNDIDLLSNGVKMRASDSNYNQATTFVYLAMAENPFQFATAR